MGEADDGKPVGPAAFDAAKLSKSVAGFARGINQMMASMDPNFDKGKYEVKEILDDLSRRIVNCNNQLDRLKFYPIEENTLALDPMFMVRNSEQDLDKLEKKLRMLVLAENLETQKKNLQKTQEEFDRLQKGS